MLGFDESRNVARFPEVVPEAGYFDVPRATVLDLSETRCLTRDAVEGLWRLAQRRRVKLILGPGPVRALLRSLFPNQLRLTMGGEWELSA